MPDIRSPEKRVGLHYTGFRNSLVESRRVSRAEQLFLAQNGRELRKPG
jgi:hypothetical protein